MMYSADAIKNQLITLPKEDLSKILGNVRDFVPHRFIPNSGPQTEAFYSKADWLLYGGRASGGKSALGLGLALSSHTRSLVMRPQYTELTDLIDKTLKFYGSRDGFNGSPPPSLRTDDGRYIQFGACSKPGDEFDWQGREHDLKFFDEVVNFREDAVRFVTNWNRTDLPNQRVRTVFASNPPINSVGDWIIGMFRPWLDLTHDNPAKDGELRWFITDNIGNDIEVLGPEPIEDGYDSNGKKRLIIPKSRTFIRAGLDDNPYVNIDYRATLDALKEPYRSAMRDGNFMAARRDSENQIIPISWVREAQDRWTDRVPEGMDMTAMGVDPAAGGDDNTVLAPRYGWYYGKLLKVPGRETPYPQDVAGLVIRHRRGDALPIIDCDGGYGGGVVRHLQDNGIEAKAYKGSSGSTALTADRMHGFLNKRTEAYFKFAEALDPSQPGGSQIALPPSVTLLSDLCSGTYKILSKGVYQMESKKDIKARIGRSPDEGDAVVMAWFSGGLGQRGVGKALKKFPKVIMGYANRRRR